MTAREKAMWFVPAVLQDTGYVVGSKNRNGSLCSHFVPPQSVSVPMLREEMRLPRDTIIHLVTNMTK